MEIKLKNIFFGVLLLTSIVLNVLFLHMIFILDFSTQQPYIVQTNQDIDVNYYLISYADGKNVFFQNRNLLAASALNRGFDFIYNYRRANIDLDYIKQHPVLNEKYGAGYWLWKPYLLLKTLYSVPDGSIVLYADSSAVLRKPIRTYLNGLFTPNKDIVAFYYPGDPASRIVSRDIFKALQCDTEACHSGYHAWAGLLAIRNSPQSRAFVQNWLNACEQEDLLQTGGQKNPNLPEYTHHQHDESILSVLVNRDSNKVNFVAIDQNYNAYIKLHRRKSNESLIAYMSDKNTELEFVIQDIWPTNKLRTFMQPWTQDTAN
jgi:hypothetical protein